MAPKIEKTQSLTFRSDIEGLRGIAVLIVVAFHTGIPGFSGGFVGVDVFFVLSGYLITGLLISEIDKTSRLSLSQFYARRVRRLLPASALTLIVTLMIGGVILAPNELALAGRAARATAVYMSNIFFSLNAGYYFAPDMKSNPMLHTWSLAVEEQFYLFWPLLIVVALVWCRSRAVLVSVILAVTIISLGACVWLTAYGGTFAFYELPARAWEFGIGGLAVMIPHGILKMPVGYGLALGWLGILAILGSGHLISGSNFPGYIGLVPVMGTATALVAGAELPHRGVGVLLGSAPLQFLGTLSYSWYLWHWPFLVFSAAIVPKIAIAGKASAAAASLAVAWITHHFVENPIRFHPYLLKAPGLSLCLAAALTFCSLSAAFLSMRFASGLASAPKMKKITAAIEDLSVMPIQQCISLGDSADVKTCVFGHKSSVTNMVLFGDSHASQWFDPLDRIAEERGWKLTTIVKSLCPATDVRSHDSGFSFATACDKWRAEAVRRIVSLRPTIVVIGNATNYFARDTSPSRSSFSVDEWRDGTRRTLQALAAASLPVVVVRDNPFFTFDIPACVARSVRNYWYPKDACQIDRSTSLNLAAFEAEREGARGLPNVHFIDLTDQLCKEAICWSVRSGEVMYRDNNHLTGSFASSLTPALKAKLLPILTTADDLRVPAGTRPTVGSSVTDRREVGPGPLRIATQARAAER